jgi:Ca-activated chloride channel family protein
MLDLKTALGIAKRFGVTVYTIGIGEPMRNFWGQIEDIDMSLLSQIAQETGGKAFRAGDGHELRAVYEQINELEKTERSVTMYNHYHEAGIPLLWLTLLLLVIESLLRITVWRRLWWR